jgi:hypothetical protein
MGLITIKPEFALEEMRRNESKFWDVYTSESSGVITCNQNPDTSLEDSLEMLKKAFRELKADRVKLRASKYSREEKGKKPGLKNDLDCWVELDGVKAPDNKTTQLMPGIDNTLLALLNQNFELRMKLMEDRIRRENEGGHPLDSLAHTLLTDPTWKMGILGALNKFAGITPAAPVSQAPAAPAPGIENVTVPGVNEKALEVLRNKGINLNELISIVAEYENKNPGSVDNFKQGLQGMGITGKDL